MGICVGMGVTLYGGTKMGKRFIELERSRRQEVEGSTARLCMVAASGGARDHSNRVVVDAVRTTNHLSKSRDYGPKLRYNNRK